MEKLPKGRWGEQIAREWIEKRLKIKVVEANFRSPFGEIDLIGWDRECLVFVEVKTRSGGLFGLPEEAVDGRKRDRIRRVAEFYLLKNGYNPNEVFYRFDVVAVDISGKKPKITHHRGAF